jgi:N-methylhydantoinase A/oxoprolinase/acetone carboxylase beta subunit
MDISGNEVEPVDLTEVRRIGRRMIEREGAKAFAVSGYGGSVNPMHEIQVREGLVEETGLDVCCGHELSDLLDFRVRAHTAVLNAGIIPLLERFLEDCGTSLQSRGIDAPLMVVKGDGTLMRDAKARLHPVETILSGPAASIAGARYLTRRADATIVDVGGTTSDIGRLNGGSVDVCTRGAVVGRWRTHVRAVDMHTLGLGGDSEIFFEKQEIHVGPKRVAPICWLASSHECADAFAHIRSNLDYYATDTRLTEMFIATGRRVQGGLTAQERAVLELVASVPKTVVQLVEDLGIGHPVLLQLKRLESEYLIQRCGLTPTDLLHATGAVSLWEPEASVIYQDMIAEIAQRPPAAFRDEVFSIVTERLVFELVKRQLNLEYTGEDLEDSATGKALFDTLLKADNPRMRVSAELTDPVIGLGAAASLFLEEPAGRLSTPLIVPAHAAVANAVGAVTSLVRVSKRGSIAPSPDGLFLLSGVKGSYSYKDFDKAHDALVEFLTSEVLTLAREAGTDEKQVEVEYEDNIGMAADGAKVFIERNVTVGVTGLPSGG